MRKMYVLKTDAADQKQSAVQSFGVAVESVDEAERYVFEGGVGSEHAYEEVLLFPNKDEAVAHANEKLGKFPNGTGNEYVQNLFNHHSISQREKQETVEYCELAKVQVITEKTLEGVETGAFYYNYEGNPIPGSLAEVLTFVAKDNWQPVFIKADDTVLLKRIQQ